MATEQKTKKGSAGVFGEPGFTWTLLAFSVLEIFLVVVLLINAFNPVRPPENVPIPPANGGQTPPPPAKVFSGGVLPTRPVDGSETKTVSGELYSNFMLMLDAESNEVLATKGADTRFSPASMTKVMTLIVACEQLTEEDLERRVTLTQAIYDYVRTGNHEECEIYGHDVGDEIKLGDLLYGIALESASDCVMMVVQEICPRQTPAESEAAFAELMRAKAVAMGLTDTSFDNAVGYESSNNYTTAREMAMIMSYALQSDLIYTILTTPDTSKLGFKGLYYPEGEIEKKEFPFTYYNTLQQHRYACYKEFTDGTEFKLNNMNMSKFGGKTGYWDSSFLVCFGTKAGTNERYVLVLGDSSASTVRKACYQTMVDVKYCFETFVK